MFKPRRRRIRFQATPEMERARADRLMNELVPLLRSMRDSDSTAPLLRFEAKNVLAVSGGLLDAVTPDHHPQCTIVQDMRNRAAR
ncbi:MULTISPECIES: hypothetical protein [unclassified Methylobacterium]|uniref:hypothetical protein n=1 Tax=unclassified Methylobacterium TaxID=2615210 RepID=UPI00226A49CF|nr:MULTISPECIES: hypothetical protein [unclassified Methylobacterium]